MSNNPDGGGGGGGGARIEISSGRNGGIAVRGRGCVKGRRKHRRAMVRIRKSLEMMRPSVGKAGCIFFKGL